MDFHATRKNQAKTEDYYRHTDESIVQSADIRNIAYKERSGSTDAFFKNKWATNHNESLIPVNYQDQLLREQVKPVADSGENPSGKITPIKIAQTYSLESIKQKK